MTDETVDRQFGPIVTPTNLAITAGIVLLIAGANVLNNAAISLMTAFLVLALFSMSYNLMFGYTGLLSFGHAAFYGTGIYMLAITLDGRLEFIPGFFQSGFVQALILSILVTAIMAAIIGFFCVQRKAFFFAIMTIAFNMMLFVSVDIFSDLTGGENGIIITSVPVDLVLVSFPTSNLEWYFYFALGVTAISIYLLWRIVNSPYGQILVAIRENEQRAAFVGIPVKFYKWTSFVIGGLFAGVAGVLIAPQMFTAAPSVLHWSTGANPLVATLIGGPGYFLGPVVGTGIFMGVEEFASGFTKDWQIFLGLIILPLVIFIDGGVLDIIEKRGEMKSRLSDSLGLEKVRDSTIGDKEEDSR